jgi:hypothetical protein
MPLFRLTYFSRLHVHHANRAAMLDALSLHARYWNETHAVTSAMVSGPVHVLQVIEGRRRVINDLFARITRDPRHRDVEVLESGPVDERQFAPWSFVHVDIDVLADHVVRRYSPGVEFDPSLMTPATALLFLRLAAHQGAADPSIMLEADDLVAV